MVASSSRGIGGDAGPADLSLCRPFSTRSHSNELPCRHNEDVGIIVQTRRRDAVWNDETERTDQPMERLAGAARMNAAMPVEGKQRRLVARVRVLGATSPDVAGDQFGDARPVRDKTALPELTAPHDEQAALGVDVAQAQTAGLAGAQPQPVAEGEDGAIRGPSLLSARVVRQSSGGSQQASGVRDVEDERNASGGCSSRPGMQG